MKQQKLSRALRSTEKAHGLIHELLCVAPPPPLTSEKFTEMTGLTQDIAAEIFENWPAFAYKVMTIGFSITFLRERRKETKAMKRSGDSLQKQINNRFERLELLVQKSQKLMN